ncbi:type II toxin-antitoxin system RelE/ParE family toxin [Sphingomonas sp. HF-S4]|uniref:Type II toxin-antitoxin system RelE/ParE family toxin n=1 Tax=Sphingomonas agrestis TaxID=3080540 RepID=A0ABU3YAU9_9SPHN|nr:type II toxin-antitoxin system RelE/ParE family toxin [Sphingomonas sp. HF-S4]MDV3458387.1 type II toxin-antitoxin system RelE/ParE family toxin [Sphingomonas sp. HF-S4]
MKVILAPLSISDLRAIGDHIALSDPVRAATFIEELFDAALDLAQMPNRFPLVEGRRDMRHRTVGKYLIFYRVDAASVDVARILHGARDYHSLLDIAPGAD